jgi:hypothetical protein
MVHFRSNSVPEPWHIVRQLPLQQYLIIRQFMGTCLQRDLVAARVFSLKPDRHEQREEEGHAVGC